MKKTADAHDNRRLRADGSNLAAITSHITVATQSPLLLDRFEPEDVLVHVEGQTEETFGNEVLAPHPYDRGRRSVSALEAAGFEDGGVSRLRLFGESQANCVGPQ